MTTKNKYLRHLCTHRRNRIRRECELKICQNDSGPSVNKSKKLKIRGTFESKPLNFTSGLRSCDYSTAAHFNVKRTNPNDAFVSLMLRLFSTCW